MNQHVHPRNLIGVFVVHRKKLCILGYPKNVPSEDSDQTAQMRWAVWSESSLGTHVRRYIFDIVVRMEILKNKQ